MPSFTLLLLITAILVLVLLTLTGSSLRIVPEYKRLVVFRLGKMIGARGPGVVLLLPFIDLAVTIDLREQTAQIKTDAIVTQDKTLVEVELTLRYRVVAPVENVMRVYDTPAAIEMAAKSALQAIVARQAFSDLIFGRDRLSVELRDNMRDAVTGWGLEIIRADLREPRRRQTV